MRALGPRWTGSRWTGSRWTGSRWTASRWIGLLVAGLLLAAAPWRLVDPDSLSRLAVGRWLVEQGPSASSWQRNDPFTFGPLEASWHNPEWLSDLLWRAAEAVGGERVVVLWALALVLLGGAIAYRWALARGASPALVLALFALWLPLGAERLVARGELHALWALPLAALLAWRLRQGRWLAALPLLALGLLWPNLHGSAVLLPLLVASEALGALAAKQRGSALVLACCTALCLLLPLFAPGAYAQAFEHLTGAGIYRQTIQEWQPPWRVGGAVALSALAVLTVLALLGWWQRFRAYLHQTTTPEQRADLVAGSARLALALVLAWGAQRFTLLLLALALPELALGLEALSAALASTWRRRAHLAFAGLAACCAMLTIATHRLQPRPPVLEAKMAQTARELRRLATPTLRLLAPFDSGPWLLYAAAARRPLPYRLFVDPRNTRGADRIAGWLRLLRSPEQLDAAGPFDLVEAVFVQPEYPRQRQLAAFLARSARWHRQPSRPGTYLYLRQTPR